VTSVTGPAESSLSSRRGRRSECKLIDGLLEGLRAGRSGALVLHGEPGIGKTALLEYAIGSASDLRILRAVGVESELELAFAGLHQLCAPELDRLDRLPGPQRDALTTVFGLSAGSAPERLFVGLAVLSLLSLVAEERPLVCIVDDAQWLDRASAEALTFVARRLFAEPIVMLFAAREPSDEFRGLPEAVVEGLGDEDAHELLRSAVVGPLDERLRDRIVAETRGNPLALLELPRGLSPARLAGGFGLPAVMRDAGSLSRRIEESFLRRLESMSDETRLLLLVAAAEPLGDPVLVWSAAERLGITHGALAPAEAAGLLEIDGRVRFRHPLVRSAVYRAAPPNDRQRVHSKLAEVTDPDTDPDRRAWHRAEAAAGPDDEVAAELERSAGRAQARAGLAAAAAFLERAVGLTLDPALRTQRALAAARAKFEAAAPDAASALLAAAEQGPLDELQRARVERLRAQIAFGRTGSTDILGLTVGPQAPALLLDAARRLEPLDLELARETYLDAVTTVMCTGSESGGCGVRAVAEAARQAPPGPQPPRTADLLLDGLAARFTEPYAVALPSLRRAVYALAGRDGHGDDSPRWLWFVCPVTPEPLAPELWDDEIWHELATRAVGLARDAGALAMLPNALTYRASLHVLAGEFAAGSALIEEAYGIAEATGSAPLRYPSLLLAAWRGRESAALETIEAGIQDARARGLDRAVGFAQWVTAVLYNGLGRYEDALSAAQRACAHEDLGFFGFALSELVEAAARTDRREVASDALGQLEERTRASGTDWALGIEARSRALLSEGEVAERLYREAIERLARTRIRVELARAHLHYGEWLRREKRRVDARDSLRRGYDAFASMGAEGFADRAQRELLATGETVRKRGDATRDQLTPQEAQVARLARERLSNSAIGAQLFISPRTVEYHLHKVFTKLNISSRVELDSALPREPDASVAT
jgi:DNA-binding CsgD family transcriptional regulator